jgi:hypothetical protein
MTHSDSGLSNRRRRPVPERLLADEEATLLLADLPAECFLLQVAEPELVEDAADLLKTAVDEPLGCRKPLANGRDAGPTGPAGPRNARDPEALGR